MRGIRLRKHFLEYFTGSVYGRYRRAAGLLLQLFTFICALGFDVFLKKQAMEMLIDQIREDYPVDHSKKKKS